MVTKGNSTRRRTSNSSKRRYIGKPTGIIQERVEKAGPLERLQEESQEYLDAGKFPSDITESKAKCCVNPTEENEGRLRQLGEAHLIASTRFSILGTIGRVRLLQADEAPPNSDKQNEF
jgi:hypothetical protein